MRCVLHFLGRSRWWILIGLFPSCALGCLLERYPTRNQSSRGIHSLQKSCMTHLRNRMPTRLWLGSTMETQVLPVFFSVSNHPFYSNVVFPLIYLIIWSVSSTMFGLLTQCPFWSVSIVDRCHDPPSSYLQDYCFRYVFDPVLLGQFSPWWLKKNIIGCEYDVLHTEQVRHVRHLHVIVCPYTLW